MTNVHHCKKSNPDRISRRSTLHKGLEVYNHNCHTYGWGFLAQLIPASVRQHHRECASGSVILHQVDSVLQVNLNLVSGLCNLQCECWEFPKDCKCLAYPTYGHGFPGALRQCDSEHPDTMTTSWYSVRTCTMNSPTPSNEPPQAAIRTNFLGPGHMAGGWYCAHKPCEMCHCYDPTTPICL